MIKIEVNKELLEKQEQSARQIKLKETQKQTAVSQEQKQQEEFDESKYLF